MHYLYEYSYKSIAAQLNAAAKIKKQIASLENKLNRILGTQAAGSVKKRKRGMSATARAMIAAAQKARWAKAKGKSKVTRVKRKMSAAAGAKIAAATKARWAKAKAVGKRRL